ncbi:hypothetical protein [Cupriavidus agavae]|nr:hypothetical protein [Cupriavidus agavae]
MRPQALDVARFDKERFTGLFDQWRAQIRDGETTATYDTWLELRYLEPGSSHTYKQGAVVFDLIHGVVYEVRTRDRLRRPFRVQLDHELPYVSFRDTANAFDFPWVAFPKVFTQADLMSLRRVY